MCVLCVFSGNGSVPSRKPAHPMVSISPFWSTTEGAGALAFPQGDITDQFSQRFTEQSLSVRQALIFSDEAPSCV